jgi:hypothetical protein
METRD